MLEPQNNPDATPNMKASVVTRLTDVASQIIDDAPNEKGTPEVVFIESSEPVNPVPTAEAIEPVRKEVDTNHNLDAVESLAREIEKGESLEAYREIQDPDQQVSCFGVDPFAMTVDGEVPSMPAIPTVDAMTRRILARKSGGGQHAWRLMPTNPVQGPAPQELPGSPEDRDPAGDLINGNKDCFYAQPGDVVFVDGNLGFDHIDLSVYSIDNATFQPDAIILFVGAEDLAQHDPDLIPKPITIRHRGIGFAIFQGGVIADL